MHACKHTLALTMTLAFSGLACASVRLIDRTPPRTPYSGMANVQTFSAEVTPPTDYAIRDVWLEQHGARNPMRRAAGPDLWQLNLSLPPCDEIMRYRFTVDYARAADPAATLQTQIFPDAGAFLRTFTGIPAGCTADPTLGARAFAVNTRNDAVDTAPGDGVCRTMAGDCSLRAAVMEANALPGLNLINLPHGIYRLTLTGTETEGTPNDSVGDLDITDSVAIRGSGECSFTMSSLFVLPRYTDSSSLEGAYAPRPDSAIAGVAATIDARASADDDALGIDRAFDVYRGSRQEGEIYLSCLQIRGGNLVGGGAGNAPVRGSGILNRATLLLDRVVVADNTQTGHGQGIGIFNNGYVILRDSALYRNRSAEGGEGFGGTAGAGLFNAPGARASLERSLVAMNHAARASGIWNGFEFEGDGAAGSSAELSLVNTTLVQNSCSPGTVRTKAALVNSQGGRANIAWSTLVDQTRALYGVLGSTTLGSSIVWVEITDTPGDSADDGCEGRISSLAGNFVTHTHCTNLPRLDRVVRRLRVGRFEDAGGFTPVVPLYSPLDAAEQTALEGGRGLIPCPELDQRRVARPQLGDGSGPAACDAGAFERQPTEP